MTSISASSRMEPEGEEGGGRGEGGGGRGKREE